MIYLKKTDDISSLTDIEHICIALNATDSKIYVLGTEEPTTEATIVE